MIVPAARRERRRGACSGTAILVIACVGALAFAPRGFVGQAAGRSGVAARKVPLVACRASVVDQIKNPVKTVADAVSDFYKLYPQPPVLPMYRLFLMDLLKQLHLTSVDSRFKYDAVFGLGVRESFTALMGSYDKIGSCQEADKIWPALVKACGLDPSQVNGDAETLAAWAKSSSPAQILQTMEGTDSPADQRVAAAFSNIKSSLYSQPFSIGLFKIMEYSGVDTTKENVEEWAKALQVPASKPLSDLDTYKRNLNKLQKAEEMMREVEIREKKKLAERLEEKAKALAAKAAAATSGEAPALTPT